MFGGHRLFRLVVAQRLVTLILKIAGHAHDPLWGGKMSALIRSAFSSGSGYSVKSSRPSRSPEGVGKYQVSEYISVTLSALSASNVSYLNLIKIVIL